MDFASGGMVDGGVAIGAFNSGRAENVPPMGLPLPVPENSGEFRRIYLFEKAGHTKRLTNILAGCKEWTGLQGPA
jgi:hypothetical protein